MQAIKVKFLGPTNNRGSACKASCTSGSITVPIDYGANIDQNQDKAAIALIRKLGWHQPEYAGTWQRGEIETGEAVYVCSYASHVTKLAV